MYAGFWKRTLATFIDSIWLYGIIYTMLWYLMGYSILNTESEYTLIHFVFEYLIPLIVVMVFWITKAATPAKMILRMKIVDAETNEVVSPKRLFVRYLAYFVAILPFGLGFLWVAWDKKKQGWHDKIAKTVVIVK